MRRLISEKMTVDAIPSSSGLAAGLNFLSSAKNITEGWRTASSWVQLALKTVREAPEPNEWKYASDEEIATEIIRKIEEKRGAKRYA